MINYLLEIVAKTIPATTPQTIRMSARWCGSASVVVNNLVWTPAITSAPTQSISIVADGEITGTSLDWGSIGWVHDQANYAGLNFNGASAKLYKGNDGDAWASYVPVFTGKIGSLDVSGLEATATLVGNEASLDTELLTLSYAGTGAAEGSPDMAGILKPWCSGEAENISPILIDSVNMVYQWHGYGATAGTLAVYERGFPISVKVANQPTTYTELIALSLPVGTWADFPALGMFRLGGAPSGKITADVGGAKNGATVPPTMGAILTHLIGGLGTVDATLGNLPFVWNTYVTSQAKIGDIVRDALLQVGGYLLTKSTGAFAAGRFWDGATVSGTLNANRSSAPLVRDVNQKPTASPVYRVTIGARRNWTVLAGNDLSDAINVALTNSSSAVTVASNAATTANNAMSSAATAISGVATINTKLDDINGDIENLQTTYGNTASAAASAAAADAAKTVAQTASTNAQTAFTNANAASLAALLSEAVLLPSEMAPGRPMAPNTAGTPAARAGALWAANRFVTVAGVGSVWTNAVSPSGFWMVAPVDAIMPIAGRTYEVEARIRVTVADSTGILPNIFAVGIAGIVADYSADSGLYAATAVPGYFASNNTSAVQDWVTLRARYIVPATGAPPWIRPRVYGNYTGNAGVSNAVYQVAYLKITDVSESVAANTAAQSASTFKDAAGSSASAAQSSASIASTKADNANTSALAAAGSQQAASSSQTAAGQSAAAALASATVSSTASGNAQTYRDQATTSASNALGSSNTASAQATIASNASTAANLTVSVSLPSGFSAAENNFWTSQDTVRPSLATPYPAGWYNNAAPNYPVFVTRANQSLVTASVGTFLPVQGRTYRVTALVNRATQIAGTSWMYLGFTCARNNGAIEYPNISVDMQSMPFNTFSNYSCTWTCPDDGIAFARPRLHWNWDQLDGSTTSANIYHIRSIVVEDITGAVAASGSASAAATSSSIATTKSTEASTAAGQASGSAGQASQSATQASTSAGQASTYRSDASTFAGNASTYANNASNSAAAAQASFVLTSQVGLGTLNKNPTFADWSGGSGTIPAGWSDWSYGAGNSRVTGLNGNPYALHFEGVAGRNQGIYQNFTAGFQKSVLEVVVEADNPTAAGLLIYAVNSSGNALYTWGVNFATEPDNSGWISGGAAGFYRRTFSKYIDTPIDGAIVSWNVFLMANWDQFAPPIAKTITFHSARFRPATEPEIAGKKALADAGTALAQISSLSGTISSNQLTMATRVDTVEARMPASGNLLTNTAFITTDGWGFYGNAPNINGYIDAAGVSYHPINEHVLSIVQTDANTSAVGFWFSELVPVIQGQWYQISCYVASHRVDVGLGVEHWSADGITQIGSAQPVRVSRGSGANGGQDLNGWNHVFFNFQPSGQAAKLQLFRWGTNPGNSDSYSWFCRPQLCQVAASNSPIAPYWPSANKAIVTQSVGAIATLQGKTSAWWEVQAVAGNGRAQLKVHADNNGGGGVDIIGDLSVSGNVLVGGSVTTNAMANESITIVRALSNPSSYAGNGSGTVNTGGGGGGGGGFGGGGTQIP